jgi:hypothetical protein
MGNRNRDPVIAVPDIKLAIPAIDNKDRVRVTGKNPCLLKMIKSIRLPLIRPHLYFVLKKFLPVLKGCCFCQIKIRNVLPDKIGGLTTTGVLRDRIDVSKYDRSSDISGMSLLCR